MGFGQGLSGLRGAAQKLDVIGNNIANAGTVGFKSSTVSFADVYASSRVGLGTQVAAVNQNFNVGTISNTGGQFDMAIDGDRGLFRVVDSSGQVMYTRNGEFSVNKDGYLINPQGYFLTAYIGDSTTPERVRVPYGNIDPKATDSVSLQANFDANAAVKASGLKETRGWIDMVIDTAPVGTPAERYYFIQNGTNFDVVDGQGNPVNLPSGTYRSGNGTVTVTAAANPGESAVITGPIDANAAFKEIAIPTGGEVIGKLNETAPGDPSNIVKTYYYRVTDGQFVWTDSDGNVPSPPDTSLTPPNGSFNSGTAVLHFTGGQLTAGGTTFPDNASFSAYTPEQLAFDPMVPGSFTHSLPMTVYDSLGNPHQLTQYFVKREAIGGESVWNVYYRLDGNKTEDAILDGGVELRFDASGRLTSPNTPFDIQFALGSGGSPAEPLKITIDYAGSTQFGGGFTPDYLQNGYATGEYSSLTFAADGSIVASYTNGTTQQVGKITLAHFNNLQGLKPVGGNAWIETAESGPPILGTPGTMGFSSIKGQALEDSNVDMGTELVNLIITQRVYQANAQTITTQNEVLQTLINMR